MVPINLKHKVRISLPAQWSEIIEKKYKHLSVRRSSDDHFRRQHRKFRPTNISRKLNMNTYALTIYSKFILEIFNL